STISPAQANYNGNYPYANGSKGEWRKSTVPVDNFDATPWGLYQLHGNVWDWVEDCRNDDYSSAPADGTAWLSGDCSQRMHRGGSWVDVASNIRAAERFP